MFRHAGLHREWHGRESRPGAARRAGGVAIGDARSAVEVPFAGGIRPMPIGPAVFAQATGAAIVTAFASINPGRKPRYVMEFEPPLFAEGRDEADRMRLMSTIVERMEAAI